MKKYAVLFLLLAFAALPLCAQKRRVAQKKVAAAAPPAVTVTEISVAEWDALTESLNKEDWTLSTALSSAAMNKLQGENDKQQLAQLRYLYVYALTGKVAQGKATYAELEKALPNFIGREFVMPSRTILADCNQKVNYICSVKDEDGVLRVTAADKVATIHLFEYVKLSESFDAAKNDGKSAALSGILEAYENYSGKPNTKIVRLIFAAGLVTLAPTESR
jgi:hypothetical protein